MTGDAAPPDPTAPAAPVGRRSVFESAAEAFFGLYFGVAAGVIVGLVLAGRGIWHLARQGLLAAILMTPVYGVICVLGGAIAGVAIGGGSFLVVAVLAWAMPEQKKIVWTARIVAAAAMVAIAGKFLIDPPVRARTALGLDDPPPVQPPQQDPSSAPQ